MLKTFIAFVKKEMYHILRDVRTLLILFGMPIALVLIFGYTVTNEFKGASVGIVDQAQDDLSRQLITKLTASGHFELVRKPHNIEALEADFRAGDVKLGIIIPPDFEKYFLGGEGSTIQLISDATEPNYAVTLTNYASQMIRDFQQEQFPTEQMPYAVAIENRMFYNPELVGAYNFIPGVVALILMLISAMMTSLTIAREKESGTMDLLLVSPLNPVLIILGKVTPYVVLSFINALVVFAMGWLIFDVPVRGSLALLLALCLLYLMVALALGILISTRSDSQQTAMMMSMFVLLMPTMLLSGFIFPIASMPAILQFISKIIPAKYFILIEKAIMLKGAGWEAIAIPAGVLLLMMFVLLAAARKNFKVVYD
ncbi:MAG: ABC transporter permease [Bacteroidetes bacterium]|nr:ABC transporter permease [Bacteroidota bacterium]